VTIRFWIAAALVSSGLAANASYVPQRVFDAGRHSFTDFEAMTADLASADVVLVGEEHNSENSHRLELALLERIARRRGDVSVGFEMFERDVQEPLDHFQMGHMDEHEFLGLSRPWPNYADAYKPLVDFAIAKHWPIFASNAPRPLAARVAAGGLDVLKNASAEEASWIAHDLQCDPHGRAFDRFAEAMGGHEAEGGASPSPSGDRRTLERFYEAQCVKDETMGESIAEAYAAGTIGGKHPLVVHFNGAFHTDFREGTTARVARRLKGRRIRVLTLLPVADLDTAAPTRDDRRRADYLVYTEKNE
jgi:uncharacterized iron-regulated protein